MSGAHDVARDAAKRLLAACQDESATNETMIFWFQEDIETVARYLGVDVNRTMNSFPEDEDEDG